MSLKDQLNEYFQKWYRESGIQEPGIARRVLISEEKPTVAGAYNIEVEGLRSLLPLFLTFDGTEWERPRYDGRRVFWFPDSPLGGPFRIGSNGVPL